MPKFVIEREIPGLGNLSDAEIREISAKSVAVLREMGPEIQWGQREGKNGFTESDWKFQFSAKYNFSFKVGG